MSSAAVMGGIVSELNGGTFSNGAIIAAASAAASMGLNELAKNSQSIDRQGVVGEGADRKAEVDMEVDRGVRPLGATNPNPVEPAAPVILEVPIKTVLYSERRQFWIEVERAINEGLPVYFKCMLNPEPGISEGIQAAGKAVGVGYAYKAWDHASKATSVLGTKGLIQPLKSGKVQGFFKAGSKWGTIGAILGLGWTNYECLTNEYNHLSPR